MLPSKEAKRLEVRVGSSVPVEIKRNIAKTDYVNPFKKKINFLKCVPLFQNGIGQKCYQIRS